MADFVDINQRLLLNLEKIDFSGYDPFDGLNSKIFKSTIFYKFPLLRLAWLQFHKRMPINTRPLFLVPRARNPKGLALIILGLLEDFNRNNDQHCLSMANELGLWLLENHCSIESWKHICWGYHFDWQARAFFVPKGTPNIITTCYVARALFSLAEILNEDKYLTAALDAVDFIVEALRTEKNGNTYFSYIPGDTTLVHNASLWGAAVVAQGGSIANDRNKIDLAYKVCDLSVSAQRDDGSWPYGERSHHQFRDSFHTGYNLEALWLFQKYSSEEIFNQSIDKGLQYYMEKFFLKDGLPKYYDLSVYPIDMHSTAQAVITLLRVGGGEKYKQLAERVLLWSISNMYINKTGYFKYQKQKYYVNKICYIRWTQAWMYYALAFFNNFITSKNTC